LAKVNLSVRTKQTPQQYAKSNNVALNDKIIRKEKNTRKT